MCSYGRRRSFHNDTVSDIQKYLRAFPDDGSVQRGAGDKLLDWGGSADLTLPVLLCIWEAQLSRGRIFCSRGVIVEETLLCYNR